jgi:hypothetical protein
MTDPMHCPSCGRELPAEAPAGLCQACLLQAGIPSTAPTSGAPRFAAPPPSELQQYFPELDLLALIGQGGMGAVYQARQKRLDRIIALKVLPPDLGQDPAFAERFAREARALARLNHPNLVAIYDFGQSGPWFWIAMEHVDGANLRQVLATGALSAAQALAIVPQLCEALQYAHDEGVVHRDIKPENILLDARGRPKIADFGLAKLAEQLPGERPLTASHELMGTAHYMAPEQIERSRSVDHRADIYSLGVVIYEMLTGGLPLGRFEAPSHAANVDARVDEVVLKALAKDPERRYQRADEVKSDVERISTGGPVQPDAAHTTAETTELDGILLLVAGAVLLGAALFAFATIDNAARQDQAGVILAGIMALMVAPLMAMSGVRTLGGRSRRWPLVGRVLTLVSIVPAFTCSPWVGIGLLLLALHLFRVPWMQRQVSRVRQRLELDPPAAMSGTAAVPAPRPQRSQRATGAALALVAVCLLLTTVSLIVNSGHAPLRLGGDGSALLNGAGPWLALTAVLALVAASFLRHPEAPSGAPGVGASALHGVFPGFFRFLGVLVFSSVLLAIAVMVLLAFRPELFPPSVRRRIEAGSDHPAPVQPIPSVPASAASGAEASDAIDALGEAWYELQSDARIAIVSPERDVFADSIPRLKDLGRELHGAGKPLPTRSDVLDLLPPLRRALERTSRTSYENVDPSRQFAAMRSSLDRIAAAPEMVGAIHEDSLREIELHLTVEHRNDVLKDAAARYCFTSAQAQRLIGHFSDDASDRTSAIDLLKPRLTDPERFFDYGDTHGASFPHQSEAPPAPAEGPSPAAAAPAAP